MMPTAEPPLTWLAPETDVLLVGQTPVVHVYAETGGGEFRKTNDFDLRGPDQASVARTCARSREPTASRGFATLDFACQYPASPGLFSITFDPSRFGLKGKPVEAPPRVLRNVPKTPPAPSDWIPHIYPTPEGSVRAEWSRPRWEISAELDSSRKVSEVRAVRLDADEVHERSFSLVEPGQEALLGRFLANQLRGDE
jgi:hypothetical protein